MLGRLSVGNRLSPHLLISPAPQVYSATNVELVTRTRTEHLSDQDKSRNKGGKTPFQSFLGMAQQHSSHNGVSQGWGAGAGDHWAGPGRRRPEL